MAKIIGVGDNVVDKYLHMNMMFPGGNSVNVPVIAHRHGIEAAYIGNLGNDFAGRHVLNSLKAEGIDVSHVKILEGSNAFARVTLVDGDRVFLKGNPGVGRNMDLTSDDFEFIQKFDLIHTSIYSSIENYLPHLRETGKLISFDYSDDYNNLYLEKTLPYVDFAFLSGSGKSVDEVRELEKHISSLGPKRVLITRGSEGAILYDDGKYYEQGVVPTEVIDTLGAGDSFIARYLVGVLQNEDIKESLKNAAYAAAQACKYYGGFGYGTEIQ